MKWVGIVFLSFLISYGCGEKKASKGTDDFSDTQTKIISEKSESNTSINPWENHGGYNIRKNDIFQKELEGKTAIRFISGESETKAEGTDRMLLCTNNKITIFSNVKPNSGNGSMMEVSDTGSFTVYEDQRGNLYLRFLMKKSGEGFVEIIFAQDKISLTGPGGKEEFVLKPGGC